MVDLLDDGSDADEGDSSLEIPHATASALVWRLAAELVRRYPERLWVHPEGGGMYDRVTVFDLAADGGAQPAVIFNALGSGMWVGDAAPRWTTAFRPGIDRSEWLTALARRAGLPARSHGVPPSTGSGLVARYVAAFLSLQLGAREDWAAAAVTQFEGLAERVPSLGEFLRADLAHGHRFVCLAPVAATGAGQTSVPEVVLAGSGDLWRPNRDVVNLGAIHHTGEPATAMLLRTASDLLP